MLFSTGSPAQEFSNRPLFLEKGFLLGYGHGIDTLNLPEGNYAVITCMAHMGIDLLRNHPERKKNAGTFTLYFEPQINPAFVRNKGINKPALEFGLNVGFQHMYPIVKNFLYSYILIASGPHFISVHTSRQKRGFIFSDNFGAGCYIFLSKHLACNLGFRLRHLSNGDTRAPNQGINTWNYHFGISKFIW